MRRILPLGVLALALTTLGALAADDEDDGPKAALQELNDFIGTWKASGAPDGKARPGANEVWQETLNWGWRFKGSDAWLTLDIQKGRHFKGGELRYEPKARRYQLTLTDKADRKLLFSGAYRNGYLTLDRVDPDTRETQRLTLNSAAEGARFVYRSSRKPADRTAFLKDYLVAATKEGVSLGAREKKNECVVSGGLGTTAVSHGGKTYYVCCSGCRDAFQENPEKYIKEFEARQKKK